MSKPECRTTIHRIPAPLVEHKGALSVALFHLARGESPESIPEGSLTPARLQVCPGAEGYLQQLIQKFGSERQVLIQALAWVHGKPATAQAILKNTRIA